MRVKALSMMCRAHRAVLASFLSLAVAGQCEAADPKGARKEFHIPPQPLDEALLAFSQQSELELAAVGDFSEAGRSAGVDGIMTPESALKKLLGATAFQFVIQSDGIITISATKRPDAPLRPTPIAVGPRAATLVPTNLASVVVTARKRNERLIDVPLAISAVTGERIELLGLENAAQVAKLTPGVASVDSGAGFTQLQIRGVSSSIGGNDNGYYLDDVAFTGLTVPWHPDTRSFDLDRIEILKGPQGTLFGEGSLGGTIRILTRAPELDRISARAEVGITNTDGGGSGNSAKIMGNVPLVSDQLALRVVATDEILPGWLDEASTGRRNINEQNIATRRARLRWSPNERWLSDITYIKSTSEASGGDYVGDDQEDMLAVLGTRSDWQSSSFVSSYLMSNSRLSYLHSDSNLTYAFDGNITPTTQFAGTILIGVDTHEVRWTYSLDDRLDWVAGYSHRRARRTDRLTIDGDPDFADQVNRADTIYGESTVKSRDGQWSLTTGLRYFIDQVSTQGSQAALHISGASSTFESVNPRLVIARQSSPDQLWYATAATGFRSGQLQPVASLVAAEAAGIELPSSIAPDEIRTVEVGFKQLLGGKRVLVQGAVFHSRWKDLPVRIPVNDLVNGIINASGARITGVEAGVRYTAPSSLSIELNGSVVDATYTEDVPGTTLLRGSKVYNVPKITASASASYSWALRGGLTAVASSTAFYNSARSTSLLVGSSGDAILTVGARVGVESPRGWSCYATLDNLTNEEGAVDGRSSSGDATRLRPRTFGVEIRYSY